MDSRPDPSEAKYLPTSPARRWFLVVGVWAAVACFSVGQIYVARAALGHPPPLVPLLILEVPIWGLWALLTVPILILARRYPLDRTRVGRSVLVHAAAATIIAVAAVAFQMLWYQAFNPYPLGGTSVAVWFWEYFRRYFIFGFVIYWAVVGVSHAFTNYFLFREEELEASKAKAELSEARLRALKMQLHPHFLFNTLNSVSAMIEDRPAKARQILAELAELLRTALRTDARHVVPLEAELAFVRRYLDLERIRFGERLAVDIEIDPAARRATVPSFLLQPLVENAIRHGIAHRERDGRLLLSAQRRNGVLVLHVIDNGPGLRRSASKGAGGIGLENTRKRLRELYGDDQDLSLRPHPEGGLDVRVRIPYLSLEDP